MKDDAKSNGSGDGWGSYKAKGGTIKVPYGLDKSSVNLSGTRGGSFGGGVTNLAHSLPGTSAKQKGV